MSAAKSTRRKKPPSDDPLEAYRRVRKPMPPPERVIPDKRRKIAEREAERETEEDSPGEEE
jgi:hypothetical protein